MTDHNPRRSPLLCSPRGLRHRTTLFPVLVAAVFVMISALATGAEAATITLDFEGHAGTYADAGSPMTIGGFDLGVVYAGVDFGALRVEDPSLLSIFHPLLTNGTDVVWSPRHPMFVENNTNLGFDTFVLQSIDIGLERGILQIEGFLGGTSTGVITDSFLGFRTLSGLALGTIDSFVITAFLDNIDRPNVGFTADNIVVASPVPEPVTFTLVGIGAGGLCCVRRHRLRRSRRS